MNNIICLFCIPAILVVPSFGENVKFRLSARGLIPKEAKESDLPDPFAKVFIGSSEKGRTETVMNNQYPQWNELFDFSYNNGDKITVIVQENDNAGTDGVIGEVEANPVDLDKEVERDIIGQEGTMFGGHLRFEMVP